MLYSFFIKLHDEISLLDDLGHAAERKGGLPAHPLRALLRVGRPIDLSS